jgi:hypothetical protein
MTNELFNYLGLAALAGAIVWVVWSRRKAAATVRVQAAPLIPAYQPAPLPDLIDLHIAHQDRREREIRRQAAERKLDQAVLYEETLKKIDDLLKPAGPTAPPPPNA